MFVANVELMVLFLVFFTRQKNQETNEKEETELLGGGRIWLASSLSSVELIHVQMRTDGQPCAHADAEVKRLHHQVSPLTWPCTGCKVTPRSVQIRQQPQLAQVFFFSFLNNKLPTVCLIRRDTSPWVPRLCVQWRQLLLTAAERSTVVKGWAGWRGGGC